MNNSSSPNRDLAERTRQFASDILHFCSTLPKGPETRLVRDQLLRCATSVGANYRSARRAKSRRDFVAKLSIVEEEADECLYWLDLLNGSFPGVDGPVLRRLRGEADELVAIIVACKKTARARGI